MEGPILRAASGKLQNIFCNIPKQMISSLQKYFTVIVRQKVYLSKLLFLSVETI